MGHMFIKDIAEQMSLCLPIISSYLPIIFPYNQYYFFYLIHFS